MIRTKKQTWCIATIGFFLLTGLAFAQTKSDFERAARETGCGLIPYDSLNSQCRYGYGKQREWCTGDRERGCGDLTKDQKEEARSRRDNAIECLKFRRDVKLAYDETLNKLGSENQPDLKPSIDEIIKRIRDGQPGHAAATEQTERRRDKCNELL